MHVCYNLSPTVTKWCDRLCHMLDKWWMGARQHTIKPVNLLGNVTSHLLPDVWPLNARTNKATGRNTHTHTHTHTHKPALTPHHPHLFFLACRPPHAGLVDWENCLPNTHSRHFPCNMSFFSLFSSTYMIVLTRQQVKKKGSVDSRVYSLVWNSEIGQGNAGANETLGTVIHSAGGWIKVALMISLRFI